MEVKTRTNANGGLDVMYLGANKEETVALRNAFSDVPINRKYAQAHDSAIIEAARKNPALTKYHQSYKVHDRDNFAQCKDGSVVPEEATVSNDWA